MGTFSCCEIVGAFCLCEIVDVFFVAVKLWACFCHFEIVGAFCRCEIVGAFCRSEIVGVFLSQLKIVGVLLSLCPIFDSFILFGIFLSLSFVVLLLECFSLV